MTLATFNRYVDSATGVSRTEHSSEQLGSLIVGDQVLYWKEDLKRKPFRAKGKHRKENKPGRFFLGRFRIPRQQDGTIRVDLENAAHRCERDLFKHFLGRDRLRMQQACSIYY